MTTSAEIEQPPVAPPVESEAEPPSGPAAALILAGGIAVFCMGLVTTLGEASTGIADALQWNDRVGPLSGKTLAAAWATLTAGARALPSIADLDLRGTRKLGASRDDLTSRDRKSAVNP